jgi:hypothetical protein
MQVLVEEEEVEELLYSLKEEMAEVREQTVLVVLMDQEAAEAEIADTETLLLVLVLVVKVGTPWSLSDNK